MARFPGGRTPGLVLMAAACLSAASALAADMKAEPKFRIGRMSAPAVDGLVEEREWARACEATHFLKLGGDMAFCGEARLWFGRDADNFYFASVCESNPDGGIVRGTAARNGNTEVLRDDSFEFTWVPDMSAARPDVYHLMVNANGAYFGEGQRKGQMLAWGPKGMKTASRVVDGRWHFELSIPLSTIGFDGCPGAEHGVRMCRTWKRVGSEWGAVTCFSPYVHAFFSAAACPRVVFDDAAPVVQLKELGGGEADTEYPLVFLVENTACSTQTYNVALSIRPKNSQGLLVDETLSLAPGERRVYRRKGPVQGDERADARLLVSSAGGDRTYYLREFSFRPKPPRPKWMKAGGDGGLSFQFAYFPTPSLAHVQSDVSEVVKRHGVKSMRFRILTKAGEEICARDASPGPKGVVDITFPVPDLAQLTRRSGSGEYVAELSAACPACPVARLEFQRNVFEWEGNGIGLSDVVVEPFTPLRRESARLDGEDVEKVSVVLRDHFVDPKSGLWKQVVAAGKPLLARPMRLVTASGARLEDPRLSASAAWDYDGMMEWRLTLRPGRYEPFSLEIPIRAERAPLMHACTDGLRFNYAGEVPAGGGVVWDGSKAPRNSIVGDYVPYVWVGGPLRGISAFGENDRGWEVDSENAHCQEVVREADGTVVLRLNLVQRSVDVAEARTIRIGFQATPVKPMLENWREVPAGELVGCCLYWGGYEDSHAVCPYDEKTTFWEKMAETRRTGVVDGGYLEAYCRNWPSGADPSSNVHSQRCQRASAHFRAGMNVMRRCFADPAKETVWYTNGRGVHYGLKPGATFADEWSRLPFLKRPFGVRSMAAYDLDPVASYRDYAAWWWAKAFQTGAMDHLYWDDVFCQSNYDVETTDAYRLPDGSIQPASGIFNMRALIRRGAMTAAECGKKPTGNWIHMTNTAMAPVSAFAGVHYDWEDPGSTAPFQERYSRAYMQACTIGRQFGNRVVLMGYFAPTTPERREWLRRTGVGPTLTHEAKWYIPEKVAAALDAFGYRRPGAGVRVWNYWDEDVPFPLAIDGLEWSALAMSNGKGEAMAVVCNYENRAATARVRPDCVALRTADRFRAFDAETSAELEVSGGTISVTIAPYDFVVIRMRGDIGRDGPASDFELQAAEFSRYHRAVTGRDPAPGILSFAVDPGVSKSGCDAYRVVSEGAGARITGSNMRSVWYGLYDLLWRRAGCRWFWDGDVVPRRDRIDLSGLDVHEESRFEYRAIRYFAHRGLTRFQAEHWGPDDWRREIDWCLKRRLNCIMPRIGMDDTWQRAFPEIVPYPDPRRRIRANGRGYDNRDLFWPLEYRGKLRKTFTDYAFARGLQIPTDFGTMTHWYSRTPQEFLDAKSPPFLPQANRQYNEDTGLVWDIFQGEWLADYWRLTKAFVDAGYGKTDLLHTIGLGERLCYSDRAKNLKMKKDVLALLFALAGRECPDSRILLAGWDFYSAWNSAEVRSLVPSLDPGKVVVWDYEGDAVGGWDYEFQRPKGNFTEWGLIGRFPYTFGIFLAYENALDIRANYPLIEARQRLAENDPMCRGYIFWPESSHTDTFLLRYFTANAWKGGLSAESLLPGFCQDRYGAQAPAFEAIWRKTTPVGALSGWGGNYGSFLTKCLLDPYEDNLWRKPLTDMVCALKAAPGIFRELAGIKWQDDFARRDSVDLARTVLDRLIEARRVGLVQCYKDWCRYPVVKDGLLRSRAENYLLLVREMTRLLAMHTDFSLAESYDRLNAVEPVANPNFEHVLVDNSVNGYCRSHQYEAAAFWYEPLAEALVKAVLAKVAAGDRTPLDQRPLRAFGEDCHERLLTRPLGEMRPAVPRTQEGFAAAMLRLSSAAGLETP